MPFKDEQSCNKIKNKIHKTIAEMLPTVKLGINLFCVAGVEVFYPTIIPRGLRPSCRSFYHSLYLIFS